MRTCYSVTTLLTIALLLNGCTSQTHSPTRMASNFINQENVIKTTKETYPSKNPQTVALYTPNKTPHTAYRVIGVATVSKHTLLGAARPENTLNDMMKKLAASIGGDGIINVNSNKDTMQAHVIAYQKILI